MYIICYGDSNTWGYDSRVYGGARYPESVRWTSGLSRALGCTVENDSMPGRTIPLSEKKAHALAELVNERIDEHGDVRLFVMLGSNNLLMHHGTRAEDVAALMEKFLRNIICMTKRPLIIRLLSPAICKDGTWTRGTDAAAESARLGRFMKKTADRLSTDFAEDTTLSIQFSDMSKYDIPVLFDGVHFSEEGHAAFLRGLLSEQGMAF